ncbi:LuxR C-terminal-related transcriptional regulator [Glutamicibacter sp.]|uniref:LuxR C-terminal-related transcriptional regulator n=1 Tax=Glutamicibacter sp. TaxID=1931995 RepID=UPI0028BEFC52|nr:LuxR C-terminal-related transcriptional regulator [Glutamicibacter sp.]
MIGRERELEDSLSYLSSGVDVIITGEPGSGRTTLLSKIEQMLLGEEFGVIRIAADRIQQRSFSSLVNSKTRPSRVVTAKSQFAGQILQDCTIDNIVDLAQKKSLVAIIDNSDTLDQATWRTVISARALADFRILSSQLPFTESLFDEAIHRRLRAYTIYLSPMSHGVLESLLVSRAGAPLDSTCMNSIFAKSGGLPGLALGMLDVGIREGAIVNVNGIWRKRGQLWSSTLQRLMERQITVHNEELYEALRLLSLSGPVTIEEASRLIGQKHLELLEAKGMLKFENDNDDLIATVTPPLIAEHYRYSSFRAPLRRLGTADLSSGKGDFSNPVSGKECSVPDPDALFVRNVQEKVRNQLHRSKEKWKETGDPRDRLDYARALSRSNAPTQHLVEVFNAGNEETTLINAQILELQGNWISTEYGVEESISFLKQKYSTSDVEYAALLKAAEVRLRLDKLGYDGDIEKDLPVKPSLREEVQIELRYVRSLAMLSAGRVYDAGQELAGLDDAVPHFRWSDIAMMRGLYLLGIGNHREATSLAYRVMQRARESLDPKAIQGACFLAGWCQLIAGHYSEVAKFVETALATVTPRGLPTSPLLGLLCMGSVVAGRTGNFELAELRLKNAEQLPVQDGPLPTMSVALPKGQLALAAGEADRAIEIIQTGSEQLWQRGSKWAAVQGWLIELELKPSITRLTELKPRLESVQGEFTAALMAYVEGLAYKDAELILKTAPRLLATGRVGIAINAYNEAAALYAKLGKPDESESARNEALGLISTLPPGTYDTARFCGIGVALTKRELQLAQLAASGWTNAQIADELVLSVRTVESHLRRAMKKANLTNRGQWKEFLENRTLR